MYWTKWRTCLPLSNVLFKDSSEGYHYLNDNGAVYMESDQIPYTTLLVSFIGYETKK